MEEKDIQQLKDKFGYPFKLNIGCGPTRFNGYINIDFRETGTTDLVADAQNIELPRESCNLIVAWSVLEHISWRETQATLKHWHSLLAPGGVLAVNVPNLKKLAEDILASDSVEYFGRKDRKGHIIEHLYGGQDYPGNYHCAGWKPEWLKKELRKAGFKIKFIGDGWLHDFGIDVGEKIGASVIKGSANGWDMMAIAKKPRLFFL